MKFIVFAASVGAMLLGGQPSYALVVTTTTDPTALATSLLPSTTGFSNLSVADTFGNAAQVGTFTGFTSGPVQLPNNGIVLSTGDAADTTAASHSANDIPSVNLGGGSTPEIAAYAPGKVANFTAAFDAARVTVNFTLATTSAIAFDFAFGSVEYPNFVSNFTDAAYVFLDGTQITFDQNGNPVQVGSSFASLLTTADTNTAFSNPHGLLGVLTTTSGSLSAGAHTLQFEVADTNDHVLDSALFVSDLRLATASTTGPTTGGGGTTAVPEPTSLGLLGISGLGLIFWRRRV